jgi:hypothetical protein
MFVKLVLVLALVAFGPKLHGPLTRPVLSWDVAVKRSTREAEFYYLTIGGRRPTSATARLVGGRTEVTLYPNPPPYYQMSKVYGCVTVVLPKALMSRPLLDGAPHFRDTPGTRHDRYILRELSRRNVARNAHCRRIPLRDR